LRPPPERALQGAPSLCRGELLREHLEERRLPASVDADEPDVLARLDDEIGAAEHRAVSEDDVDSSGHEHAHGAPGIPGRIARTATRITDRRERLDPCARDLS